jgi:hypothetical protein
MILTYAEIPPIVKPVFEKMRNTVTSKTELEEFIVEHWDYFLANGWYYESFRKGKEIDTSKFPRVTLVDFYSFIWSNEVSNTHSAPIGKETNWGGYKKDVPRNYPGWNILLKVTHSGEHRISCFSMFKSTGIYLGTGSGTVTGLQCDGTLFAEDFSLMRMTEILVKNDN